MNKLACNFLFQDVASQWVDTTLFLTTFTNTVYWLFFDNDILRKNTTMSQTPAKDQSHSHAE